MQPQDRLGDQLHAVLRSCADLLAVSLTGDPLTGQLPRPRRPRPDGRSPSVHAGYTQSRQVGECTGTSGRSRPYETAGQFLSAAASRQHLTRRVGVRVSHPAVASPPALARETVVTEDGLPLRPSREPSPSGGAIAALIGRASHVQWRAWATDLARPCGRSPWRRSGGLVGKALALQ